MCSLTWSEARVFSEGTLEASHQVLGRLHQHFVCWERHDVNLRVPKKLDRITLEASGMM